MRQSRTRRRPERADVRADPDASLAIDGGKLKCPNQPMKPATLPARTLSLLYERQLTLARFDERLFSLIAYYCLCHNHNGGGGGGRGGGDGNDRQEKNQAEPQFCLAQSMIHDPRSVSSSPPVILWIGMQSDRGRGRINCGIVVHVPYLRPFTTYIGVNPLHPLHISEVPLVPT